MKQTQETTPGAIDGRFSPSTQWNYTIETIEAAHKIGVGVTNERSHQIGMRHGEPLIVMMDGMLQYANVYYLRFAEPLAKDYVLGPAWLQAIVGLRKLLNGDGVIAMMRDISTDTKDNGAIESVFWAAMEAAGYTERDLNEYL